MLHSPWLVEPCPWQAWQLELRLHVLLLHQRRRLGVRVAALLLAHRGCGWD